MLIAWYATTQSTTEFRVEIHACVIIDTTNWPKLRYVQLATTPACIAKDNLKLIVYNASQVTIVNTTNTNLLVPVWMASMMMVTPLVSHVTSHAKHAMLVALMDVPLVLRKIIGRLVRVLVFVSSITTRLEVIYSVKLVIIPVRGVTIQPIVIAHNVTTPK